MRIRAMRSRDASGVASVYEACASVSAGLLSRNPERWKLLRRQRGWKGIWIVAEDHGRIVGYGLGLLQKGQADIGEIIWSPEHEGTALGQRLLDEVVRRLNNESPAIVSIWGMAGSATFKLSKPRELEPLEATGIFMAKAIDAHLLLRDAKRVLEKRKVRGLAVEVDRKSVVIGRGARVAVRVSMAKNVLFGLLLGLRTLKGEIARGGVRYSPKKPEALKLLSEAFPERVFWIEDAW